MVKQVIVVRKDLNMRKGKMCAQVAHASMAVFFNRRIFKSFKKFMLIIINKDMWEWINNSFTKIVVGCDNIVDVINIQKECIRLNILHAIIIDNGTTEFHGEKTVTCIAVGPAKAELIDSITGEYKLL